MQRRDFLKTSALSSGLFLSNNLFNNSHQPKDIDLIIDAIEKQASLSYVPVSSESPKVFKLYDFQKEIIRNIYENEQVIIIKSRQIGMSTILRAIVEINEKQFVNSSKYHFDLKYYLGLRHDRNIFRRVGDESSVKNISKGEKAMGVIDENIAVICNPSALMPLPYIKTVIAGSIDGQGRMKWVYDNAEKYGYKVFVYPYYKTTPSLERCFLYFKKNLSKKHWQQEFECKFS